MKLNQFYESSKHFHYNLLKNVLKQDIRKGCILQLDYIHLERKRKETHTQTGPQSAESGPGWLLANDTSAFWMDRQSASYLGGEGQPGHIKSLAPVATALFGMRLHLCAFIMADSVPGGGFLAPLITGLHLPALRNQQSGFIDLPRIGSPTFCTRHKYVYSLANATVGNKQGYSRQDEAEI